MCECSKDMKSLLIMYALSFLHTPYKWGGNSPMEGLDCSGLVLAVYKAFDDSLEGDMRARDIYNFYAPKSNEELREGSLLFFGKSIDEITHTAIAITPTEMVEAGGGGSKVTTFKDAVDFQASVRIRPIAHRKDLIATLFPKFLEGGI